MNIIDKLNIIDGLKDKPIIKKIGNQSIEITFNCGCRKIQHGYANKRNSKLKDSELSNRFFYIELCNIHNKI